MKTGLIKSAIFILLSTILLFAFSSCSDDEDPNTPEGGFHTSLNGWSYAGKTSSTLSAGGSPLYASYKLHYANTINGKTDIIYELIDASEYPTIRRAFRWIINADGSLYYYGELKINLHNSSIYIPSVTEIKAVYTTGLYENDIWMIFTEVTNSGEVTMSCIRPDYSSPVPTSIYAMTGGSPNLWRKHASDLSAGNGFFCNYWQMKPLNAGDGYPIRLSEYQGVHIAGLVEDDGTMMLASVVGNVGQNRSIRLAKSLTGLEQVNWGDYSGPIHPTVTKHSLSVSDLSGGDLSTDVSQSLFLRDGNKLIMMVGFTNNEIRLLEADNENYIMQVKTSYQYPASAATETWLGLRTSSYGSLVTQTSTPFGIRIYNGVTSMPVTLPDFKPFTQYQGGVVGVKFMNDRLYLLVNNELDLYLYTKDI